MLCIGCAVSVHFGRGNPAAEQAYRAVLTRPMNTLTTAASNANKTCAGGSQPNPAQCYANTKIEITDARALERAIRSVPTPARFRKANADLLRGLDVFINGLITRNDGLAAHSGSQYTAGQNLIMRGLSLQKAALAEYPADANIKP